MSALRLRRGVLMLDVLIGLAVFSIIVSGVMYAMLMSQQGMLKSGDRIRAVFLNQETMGGLRAVRDADFADVIAGTFGVRIGASGTWELSGTGVTTEDGFTTWVTIQEDGEDRFHAVAGTVWDFGPLGSGSATLVTDLTDWHRVQSIGNWSSVSVDGSFVDAGTPLFNVAAVTDTHAFVTSEISDGGVGLYVFDISSLSSPSRIASSFDLGAPGYDALVVGDTLYVATGDTSQEVRMYDISDPATFSSDDLMGSINVPGGGNVRALAYYDSTLFVAALEDVGESEIWSYDVTDPGSVILLDELNDAGSSFADIRLHDGYAYLAGTSDTMELRVADIFDPADLQFAPGGGYNLPDTPDGTSIIPFGAFVLLGRTQGEVTEELHLFDIGESPVPPSAPFNAEAGANVHAVDAEPTGTYAFVATDHDSQEFLVLDIATFAGGGNPVVETYDTTTGIGRGVLYDILHDRVFFLTNTAVLILEPS